MGLFRQTSICVLLLLVSFGYGQESVDTTTIGEVTPVAATPIPTIPINRNFDIQLNIPMRDAVKKQGERLQLDCDISGYPAPIYKWYKNGVELPMNDGRLTIRVTEWGSRLRINQLEMSDAGSYLCRAENHIGVRNTTSQVTVQPAPPTTASNNVPVPNRPSIITSDNDVTEPFCQDYKGTFCSFLKTKQIYVTSRLDQALAENKVIDLVRELTNVNVKADSQCFQKSVEASCYFDMPICYKRDQTAIQRRLCKTECQELFSICKTEFKDDPAKWKLLPECSQLDNLPGCVLIGLTGAPNANMQIPDQEEKTEADKESVSVSEGDVSLMTLILPIVLAVVLVIGIIIAIVCIYRKKKGLNGARSIPSSNGSQSKSVELSSLSDRTGVYVKEVTLDNINMLQELGAGTFGKVYHGQAFGLYGNNTASAVFIKCLEEKPSIDQRTEFTEELNSMSELRHQHILSLIAISTKGPSQCLLYEFLQLSDLRQFILNQQSHGNVLTSREVMYVVTQIASGLEYLSLLNFVHKDVAAHNVMVGNNLNVKLSTLKIAYGVHSANYCTLHGTQLPVRWLPPETITYNRYSLETDIYSFGVFLWECFSRAQVPYTGYSNQEVIEMVRSRQLLACPQACPPRIYSLMMECWHETSTKRPSAKEVHQKMRAWYLDNSYAISTSTGPSASAHSVSTSTVPSHHSSNGPPPSYPDGHANGFAKPGFGPPGSASESAQYYSVIDQYKEGLESPTDCSMTSIDDESELTEPTNHRPPPPPNNLPKRDGNNLYSSTPNQRYASLGRRPNRDPEFGSQTTPLFSQTDQV